MLTSTKRYLQIDNTETIVEQLTKSIYLVLFHVTNHLALLLRRLWCSAYQTTKPVLSKIIFYVMNYLKLLLCYLNLLCLLLWSLLLLVSHVRLTNQQNLTYPKFYCILRIIFQLVLRCLLLLDLLLLVPYVRFTNQQSQCYLKFYCMLWIIHLKLLLLCLWWSVAAVSRL